MTITVTFRPSDISVQVPPGILISEAAAMAGVADLHLPCGGRGTCGTCSVSIETAGGETVSRQTVLACVTRLKADTTVFMGKKPATALSKIVVHADMEKPWLALELSPLCTKIFLTVPAAGIDDNYSDFELLEREIMKTRGAGLLSCSRRLLQDLAGILRAQGGAVTATLYEDRLVALAQGDTTAAHYGASCDIGTTTIALRLVDLLTGRVCAVESDYNGQISRGADVISRIEYTRTPERRSELQALVLETINRLIRTAGDNANVAPAAISCLSIAGNSAMVHLFLGLPARYLREHPYVPTVKRVPGLTAAECGLEICPDAPVIFSPGVGSYVGGDITAGLLCTAMAEHGGNLSLFIDIGTNGEIVIGDGDFLLATACSAGPAFEGSGIRCGMRAAQGAIDSFTIENSGATIGYTVIGEVRPRGICGSGLISLLGEMLKAGVIDAAGRFVDASQVTGRMVAIEGTRGFMVVSGSETAHGRDIVVTEADIDNLIRTKAAIYSACDRLLSGAGLSFADVRHFLVAGGFGRFIDIEDAVRIGLFPDIDRTAFAYLGNTALAGATLALLSRRSRDTLAAIPGRITYVELSNDPAYMDSYMAALFLPHTDMTRFPHSASGISSKDG
ncbi:MAG: ASKHA domain-containing protein [Chitinispirillaceae bacterium]|jgi:uncharacterized 2Fe-2S/4Fe-4S cluster protein (DUF4445 family)|nr:ASKHA domain-containing protein [Chitinispirillaceae bacterium]